MRATAFATSLAVLCAPEARAADPPGSRADARPTKIVPTTSDGVRFFGGAPPAGWRAPGFDDSRWGGPSPGPFAPPWAAPPGGPAQPVDVPAGGRLCLRRRFSVADPARVRVLELRVAYADGFIAWLNGKEVARRQIPEGEVEAEPQQAHGTEVERIYVPAGPGLLTPDGNVLAVEIRAARPARGSLVPPAGPAGDVALVASAGVRIVRGPYLVAPRDGEVGVAWQTDLPSRGGVSLETGGSVRSPAVDTRHVVRLGGLPADKPVRYRVAAEGVDVVPGAESKTRPAGGAADRDVSGPFTLLTPAPRSRPFRFAVYGDMRAPGHEAHAAVAAGLLREAPPLVVNTGDLVNRGSEESDWQRYFDITAALGAAAPVVPALGNHDAFRAGGARKTWDLFAMPTAPGSAPGWTSFDLGGVHFVILDSNQWRSDAQRAWLVDDLAAARKREVRATFAFCHDGPYSHGFHGGNAGAARAYAPILEEGGVDLLFSGHDHIYERGLGGPAGKLPYVVTGGGGAPLYNPTCQPGAQPALDAVPGPLPLCPPSVAALRKQYHYVVVTVGEKTIELCPRTPDGKPLEPCVGYPLRKR